MALAERSEEAAVTGLWNWRVADRVGPSQVQVILAELLDCPVRQITPAAETAPGPMTGGMLSDVWYIPGAYPTVVDCYGPPADSAELAVAAEFARRLGSACLLPDDTLDAGRHLLCAPEGTIRPVHLTVTDTEAGPLLGGERPCTAVSPRCRGWAQCHRSRWAPDSVVPVLAAA